MNLTRVQADDIAAAKSSLAKTRRPTVPALEEVLFDPIPILNHGFLRVVDYMGDDAAVVQAARVSYGRGTRKTMEDRGLIRYLMRHWHTTPFEMCEIKVHVKMPIFVARQWIRHRTSSVNEISARYSILDDEFYVPEPEHMSAQSRTNRQGRGDVLGPEECAEVMDILKADAARNYGHYVQMLNEDAEGAVVDADRSGLARELARMNLTLNTYTQWYWKTNLHNLLNFLRLRADPHAQYEIRVYAEALVGLVERWVPLSLEAFREYRLGAVSLSATEAGIMRRLLAGEDALEGETGLSARELSDFRARWFPVPALPEARPRTALSSKPATLAKRGGARAAKASAR